MAQPPAIRLQGLSSISRFAAVADCEQQHFFAVIAIENDICTVAELNDPLAEFGRHVVDEAADFGLGGEDPYSLANGSDGSCGGFAAFRGKEVEEAGDVAQRCLRPLYSWHSGGSAFWPFSSFASQASASSPVT